MGAKTAVKLRKRGIAYKCDVCGRKLMTPDALEIHRRTAHNIITERRGRLAAVRNAPVVKAPAKLVQKASKEVKTRVKSETETEFPSESPTIQPRPAITKMKTNVEFECPKCFKTFPTYFPALKHIQKYHCVDRQGLPVQPHDANLIQPERLELCHKCDVKVRSIHTHQCQSDTSVPTQHMDNEMYVCAACDEWFPNLNTFNVHVVSTHSVFETLFFPTSLEFVTWKLDMEEQTGVTYSVLEKSDPKMYYHCSHVTDTEEKNATHHHMCPSIIHIREFTNGLQVHFYHRHHKHSPVLYTLPQEFRKYSISPYLARADDYKSLAHLTQDEGDMYMQFKKLMEGIIVGAAKINVTTLKLILGKALEIASILSNYDEESDDISVSMNTKQNLSDSDITKILEQPLSSRKLNTPDIGFDIKEAPKRKIEVPTMTVETKRVRQDNDINESTPKIVNSYSLAHVIKNYKTSKKTKLQDKSNDDTPSSFNDSYKDFVVKNFPSMESVASRTRSKPAILTRMGQYKPRTDDKNKIKQIQKVSQTQNKVVDGNKLTVEKVPQTQNKVVDGNKLTVEKVPQMQNKLVDCNKVTVQKASQMNNKLVDGNKLTVESTKPVDAIKYTPKLVKIADSNKVDDRSKSTLVLVKKVDNKTKSSPALSENGDEIKDVIHRCEDVTPMKKIENTRQIKRNNSRTSLERSLKKVDFEYEVKEQADDCNILILKF